MFQAVLNGTSLVPEVLTDCVSTSAFIDSLGRISFSVHHRYKPPAGLEPTPDDGSITLFTFL